MAVLHACFRLLLVDTFLITDYDIVVCLISSAMRKVSGVRLLDLMSDVLSLKKSNKKIY
jgi:hypothetical protein